jgi:hypothetical protein
MMPLDRASVPCADCQIVYDALVAPLLGDKKKTRTLNNLANVKRALDSMVATRQTDFSRAAVVRAYGPLGIASPARSSLDNAPGQIFRDLIDAYESHHAPKAAARLLSEHEALVLCIRDQAVAAQVQKIIDENKRLNRTVNGLEGLKAQIKRLPPVHPRDLVRGAPPPEPSNVVPPHPREAAAVRSFLEQLTDFTTLVWHASGALLTDSEAEVAGPGFRQALERLAAPGSPSGTAIAAPPASAAPRRAGAT